MRTDGSIDRTSICAFICINDLKAPGLVDRRSNFAMSATASGFSAKLGRADLIMTPLPQTFDHPLDRVGVVEVAGLRKTAEKNELRHAFRVGSREQEAHRAALGEPEQGCSLRADVVHDGANVVHALFERRGAGYPIGQALPSLVERHDAGEGRKTAQERRVTWHLMRKFNVRNDARDHDDIDRPVAHHLIGDIDVAAECVPGDGQYEIAHGRSFLLCRNQPRLDIDETNFRGQACLAEAASIHIRSLLLKRFCGSGCVGCVRGRWVRSC